jgi:hypothetical protein
MTYYERNKDKIKAWKKENKDKLREYNKNYYWKVIKGKVKDDDIELQKRLDYIRSLFEEDEPKPKVRKSTKDSGSSN